MKYSHFLDWLSSWNYYVQGLPYTFGGYVPGRDNAMRCIGENERRRAGRPLQVLEIGSYRGHSAALWSSYGHVTCVDAWGLGPPSSERHPRYNYGIFLRNVRLLDLELRFGYGRSIQHIRGLSNDVLPGLASDYYDIVYVDAAHDYASCQDDIRSAMRLVSKGGIVCVDDYNVEHPGVFQAVNEAFKDWSSPPQQVNGLLWARHKKD